MACDPKCYETSTDACVEYTGPSNTNLGINQGDNLSQVLTKLIEAVDYVKEKLESCGLCGDGVVTLGTVSNTDDLTNTTTLSSTTVGNRNITTANSKVSTVAGSSNIALSYDLKDAVASLGNVSIISTRATVEGQKNGANSRLVDSKRDKASFTLQPDNFPATFSAEIRYQDSSGEKVVSQRMPLSSTGATMETPLEGRPVNSNEPSTQSDVNQIFDEQISDLKGNVSSLTTLSITGDPNLEDVSSSSEAITLLYREVSSLKEQVSELSG